MFAHFQWPAIIWNGRGTTNSTETTTVMAPAVERVRWPTPWAMSAMIAKDKPVPQNSPR